VSFYLDASAVLPTLVAEAGSDRVIRFLRETTAPLVVSDFAAAEVASALARLTRLALLARDAAHRHLADFDLWRAGFTQTIDVQTPDARLANLIVRRFELGLRAPDALHLAVCRRAGATLVTLDRRLAAAARMLDLPVSDLAA
jgi:predicted nucleic acid-binding protein